MSRFKTIPTVILFLISAPVFAQFKGEVFDQVSRKPIADVDVLNISKGSVTVTNQKGEFSLSAAINDLLVFRHPGYYTDTLLLTSLSAMRKYMRIETNLLKAVTISESRSLKERYAREFNNANAILLQQGRGLLFYPSRYFSREGRNARRFVRMIKKEEKEKIIDRRYNLKSVKALIPLEQPELDAFLVRYRPDLKFIKTANNETFMLYLLACYHKFKQLPADKRVLPPLKLPDIP